MVYWILIWSIESSYALLLPRVTDAVRSLSRIEFESKALNWHSTQNYIPKKTHRFFSNQLLAFIQFYSPCPLLLAAHVILNALSYARKSCQRTCILTGEALTEWNILSMFRTFPTWLQANRKMVQGKVRIFSGKGLDHRLLAIECSYM